MAETYHLAGGGRSGVDGVDDHFFRRYRELLDAEDNAFDLEHAYEDGDRATFEIDLVAWRSAILRRESFLQTRGLKAFALPV